MPTIKTKHYSIITGTNSLSSLKSFLSKTNYSAYFILCDENTLLHCLPTLIFSCPELGKAEVIEIESGEESKSLEICASIWESLIENRADKNALIINLGGGVISDLGGFVASVYKRGIDFINIPTSLLAMADASVGGKTGIDFAGLKNNLGTFTQARSVFVDPSFLGTLPERHYMNGLAEIYKIALVADVSFWKQLQKAGPNQNAEKLLSKSIALKHAIVLKDPFDKGIRKILNFGHSIGHAIESYFLGSEQALLHGEAVVMGMLIETHLAFQKKLLSKEHLVEIYNELSFVFDVKPLTMIKVSDLMPFIYNDKKTSKAQLLFSLIKKPGACAFDVPVTEKQVEKALVFFNAHIQ